MAQYSLFQDVLSPTATDACCIAHFTTPCPSKSKAVSSCNLIVAKCNVLYIYTFDKTTESVTLTHTFELHAAIVDIVSIQRPGEGTLDYLLLSFRDAKMSLMEYSYATQSMNTVSIHYYEKEELKRQTLAKQKPPKLFKDPQNRCVAMNFYNDKLAILPFRQESFLKNDGGQEKEKLPYFPSFVISLSSIDPKIRNVVDMVFLFDYFEPTIAILYEPLQTWTGRLAAVANTQCLSVISIDLTQTSSPATLFKVEELPFNNFTLLPVPSPVGGVVIVSPNSLIHVDQTSIPGVLCSVNYFYGWENQIAPAGSEKKKRESIYKDSNVTDLSELGLTLEGCGGWFVNPDTLMMVLRSGEVITATLKGKPDSGQGWGRRKGGVLGFNVERLGLAAAQPSCWCGFNEPGSSPHVGFLFLGSRTTESMLIKIIEQGSSVKALTDEDMMEDLYGSDNKTSQENQTMMTIDEGDDLDDDDDFIYGKKTTTSYRKAAQPVEHQEEQVVPAGLKFKVLASFTCLAPFASMAVGMPHQYSEFQYDRQQSKPYFDPYKVNPSTQQPELYTPPPLDLEIVGCIGHKSKGALAIIQENIRPQILWSFSMQGVLDMWSLKLQKKQSKEDPFHKYLLLTKEDATMVIETGEEFQEIETGDFHRDGPTVCAETLFHHTVIAQVHPNGVYLLDSDLKLKKKLELGDENTWVVSASVDEPYISLLLSNGALKIVLVESSKSKVDASIVAKIQDPLAISACCLYSESAENPILARMASSLDSALVKGYAHDDNMDYTPEHSKTDQARVHYCVVTRENATLEILKLPSLTPCFTFHRFDLMDPILSDQNEQSSENASVPIIELEELLVVSLGVDPVEQDCYLFARFKTGDLVIYKSFLFPGSSADRLNTRFVKCRHTQLTRSRATYRDTEGDKLHPMDMSSQDSPSFLKKHYMRKFTDLGEATRMPYCGVFLGGKRPCFAMLAKKGEEPVKGFDIIANEEHTQKAQDRVIPSEGRSGDRALRVHPMMFDGTVQCFADFNNMNCPYGFVYCTEQGELRISRLLPHFDYHEQKPFCKVILGRTPHNITYHYESKTYVMATSKPAPFLLERAKYAAALSAGVLDENDEASKPKEPEPLHPGEYRPEILHYSLELVSPVTWETVDIHDLEEGEYVMSLQCVLLESKQTATGKKLFLAVGTAYYRGEDLATRGRILLYDIIDVVPEPDNPQTDHKLKLLYVSDEKSPVTAVCEMNGFLLAAIGSKIIIHQFENSEDLTGIAFLDVNLMVTSVSVMKNLVLAGDLLKGSCLLAFQQDPPKLALVSKDFHPMSVTATGFVVDDTDVGFLVADSAKNMHIFQYLPYNVHSMGGRKLVRRGDFHVGSLIVHFSRVRRMLQKSLARQHFNVGATADGGIFLCTPVSEKMYKRLYALYSRMVNNLQHYGGLNPRGFRQTVLEHRPTIPSGPPGPKSVLDGNLIYEFVQLSRTQQEELAKAIGSNTDLIMDDLLEIASGLEYF